MGKPLDSSMSCGLDDMLHSAITIDDCVHIVNQVAGADASADDVMQTLTNTWVMHPPTVDEMCKFALLLQQCDGTLGVEEYAVTSIYMAAMTAIMTHVNEDDSTTGSHPEMALEQAHDMESAPTFSDVSMPR